MTTARDDDLDVLEAYRAMTPAQKEAIIDQASPALLDLLREEERRQAIARSPLSMALLYENKKVPARHQWFIDKLLVDVAEGRCPRLILSIPPRHAKTWLAVWWMSVWYLTKFPDRRVMLTMNTGYLAKRAGRFVRNAIREHAEELGIDIAEDSGAVDMWDLAPLGDGRIPGGMVSVGIDGTITGIGTNLLIVDDPHKSRAEAESPVLRQHVWDFMTDTALSRLESPDAVIVIMQRWHDDDLVGRLQKEHPGLWRVVELPALAEENDELGRAPGEPLWPTTVKDGVEVPQYDLDWAKKRMREAGPYGWSSQYQQRPVPREGGLWQWKWIGRATALPDMLARIVVAVDPAVSAGDKSDETGIIVAGRGPGPTSTAHGYVIADKSGRYTPDQWGRVAMKAAVEFDADAIVFETNQGGDMVKGVLLQAFRAMVADESWPEKRPMPRLIPVHASKGKIARAEPIAQQYAEGRWQHVGLLPELEYQLTTYTVGTSSPDRLDALVWAATELLPAGGSGLVILGRA